MNNYSELSDLEINKLIEKIITPDCNIIGIEYGPGMFSYHVEFYGSDIVGMKDLPDYCDNPADSWKLMVDNVISLVSRRDDFESYDFGQVYMGKSKNPGRAVAECFLMIKGGEV